MAHFQAADILLPDLDDYESWAVVACDQYSSNPDYWNGIYERIKDKPSTLHLILPEAWLNTEQARIHQSKIRPSMEALLQKELLKEYPGSYIYVERTLSNGTIRQGLIGALDLDSYDYHCPSTSAIRATEATILDRIPPRALIRQDAILEFPHILLLQNDVKDHLFQSLASVKHEMPVVYDFDLMENGGHITGRLIRGELKDLTDSWIAAYESSVEGENPLLYAVGDGNHSLAAAKAIWKYRKEGLSDDQKQNHPSRYALAELENLHSEAQQFEPIHRILKGIDVSKLLQEIPQGDPANSYPIEWVSGDQKGTIYLDASISPLPLAVLQKHLDAWLGEFEGDQTQTIDYIHGEKELEELAQKPDSIGFFLPAITKDSLFETIQADGSLPRKTFSMGHAHEKRYYLEGRLLIPKAQDTGKSE